MSTKYKHDEIVRAWLDGKEIEILIDDVWVTYVRLGPESDQGLPQFSPKHNFRVKPQPRIVTLYLYRPIRSKQEFSGYRHGAVSREELEGQLQEKGYTLITSYQVKIPQEE